MKTIMLNQKSELLFSDVETYVTNTKIYQKNFVIFPSSIYLNYFTERGYNTGSQNIAESSKNNQTGEITGKQLTEIGSRYVIIGHSERRKNQKEDSSVLINKMNEAINNNLNIVYCIGESLVDYKLNNTSKIIINEINDVLKKVIIPDNAKIYIAYEPIWAIGTGFIPTQYEIEKVVNVIKDTLKELELKNVEILYGGSVNDENIENLLKIECIDGFLIGGASNDYQKTINICEKVNKTTK